MYEVDGVKQEAGCRVRVKHIEASIHRQHSSGRCRPKLGCQGMCHMNRAVLRGPHSGLPLSLIHI